MADHRGQVPEFPGSYEGRLNHPQVGLFAPEKVHESLLLNVHTERFVRKLYHAWYSEEALYSVGGCVEATNKVLDGELENALVFTVAAGHHAERDSAWGGTYASCAGPAFVAARQAFGPKRFAILDTDRHRGNGTRDVFVNDDDVLHVCFCGWDRIEGNGTKICADTAFPNTDETYMEKVRQVFLPLVREFKPHMILHNLGHDTCQLDCGDLGLTEDFYPWLVSEITACAAEVCGGKYVVLTHGGKRADVTEYIFPKIIEILAGN